MEESDMSILYIIVENSIILSRSLINKSKVNNPFKGKTFDNFTRPYP